MLTRGLPKIFQYVLNSERLTKKLIVKNIGKEQLQKSKSDGGRVESHQLFNRPKDCKNKNNLIVISVV